MKLPLNTSVAQRRLRAVTVAFAVTLLAGSATPQAGAPSATGGEASDPASVTEPETLVTDNVVPDGGLSFRVELSSRWSSQASGPSELYRSTLVLREDGAPLGPENSQHAEIREFGRGAYSHWGDYLGSPHVLRGESGARDRRRACRLRV